MHTLGDQTSTTSTITTSMAAAAPEVARGTVVEQASQVPLAGVTVAWLADSDTSSVELGRATTGPDGGFGITAADTPEARAELRRLACEGAAASLVVVDVDGSRLPVQVVQLDAAEGMRIELTPDGGVGIDRWQSLSNYLLKNLDFALSNLAGELAAPRADSPTEAWSTDERARALQNLQHAADAAQPDAAVAVQLLTRDEPIKLDAVANGALAEAFFDWKQLAAEPAEVDRLFVRLGDRLVPRLPASDLELYRDYLRGVWVTAAQNMYDTPAATTDVLEAQLDRRFRQDFHTGSLELVPVERLLNQILIDQLITSVAGGGFGISPAAIPPQGAASPADYLDRLVGLSGVSRQELRNRFRVSFERAPGELANAVQINIETLQGLLSDTYQSPFEPFPADPAVVQGKPLIFEPYLGNAPFFLEYEEWLAQQAPFYPENLYDVRRAIPQLSDAFKWYVTQTSSTPSPPTNAQYFDSKATLQQSGKWLQRLIPLVEALNAAVNQLAAKAWDDAWVLLYQADSLAAQMIGEYPAAWRLDRFWWLWSNNIWNDPPDSHVNLRDRARMAVADMTQLQAYEAYFDGPYVPTWTGYPGDFDDEFAQKGLARGRTMYIYWLGYARYVLLPYLYASMFIETGQYARAIYALSFITGNRVGVAELDSTPAYADSHTPALYGGKQKSLPYTVKVAFDHELYTDPQPEWVPSSQLASGDAWVLAQMAIPAFELRFFKLRQGDAMLAWADLLYRLDDPSSIRRARELYKGVLFMHGEDPDIAPHFPRPGAPPFIPGTLPLGIAGKGNPARQSQVQRARQGLYQIEHGLNAYGYRDDMVPILRYLPLKTAADQFAVAARHAQDDFIDYMGHLEQSQIDEMQAQAMVKKAEASLGIATEQHAIAQFEVGKAQAQVAAVQAQIDAKRAEIADKGSLFSQMSDFLGGIGDAAKGMVPLAKGVMAEDGAAHAVTSDELAAAFGKAAQGGSFESAKGAAVDLLGSGAAFMVGYGAFAYAGYTSLSGMADAARKRDGELNTLINQALPAAQALVRVKERSVQIADYQAQIAQADLDYNRWLLRFQRERFLNKDFWRALVDLSGRLMHRYLELGAQTGWFTERALAFEQNRAISIMRLSYHKAQLRDVTGADQLLADLAELEANRLQGVRESVPVKYTFSLARDFPLAYGQLKKSGVCQFRTSEEVLRRAYPGTYGYRVRALTIGGVNVGGPPPRGLVSNLGISMVSGEAVGDFRTLARFPDALPLSEFRVREDMFLYGLPGETLMQFEGSGIETTWRLELPPRANPDGLRSLTDVLLTFDMNASYSRQRALDEQLDLPGVVNHSLLLSASAMDPKQLDAVRDGSPGSVTLHFDVAGIQLSRQAAAGALSNMGVFVVGDVRAAVPVEVGLESSPVTMPATIVDGVELSNAGVLADGNPARPLNAAVGARLAQTISVTVQKAGIEDVLKRLVDVGLWLEFSMPA